MTRDAEAERRGGPAAPELRTLSSLAVVEVARQALRLSPAERRELLAFLGRSLAEPEA